MLPKTLCLAATAMIATTGPPYARAE